MDMDVKRFFRTDFWKCICAYAGWFMEMVEFVCLVSSPLLILGEKGMRIIDEIIARCVVIYKESGKGGG